MSTECSDDELLVPELMSSYDRHRSDFVNRTHSRVGHLKTWPTSIGIMQIVIGFLLVFLGMQRHSSFNNVPFLVAELTVFSEMWHASNIS